MRRVRGKFRMKRSATTGCDSCPRRSGRLQLTFRRFINVFSRPEHPPTQLLDDLQRLDPATLDKAVEVKVNSARHAANDGLG
jgi:hypothetical protein